MDAIELLGRDYRMVTRLFCDYERRASEARRRRTVDAIVDTLSTYLALEEMMVYPLVQQVVPNGNHEIDFRLVAHVATKHILVALYTVNRRSRQERNELVAVLREEVEQHRRFEAQLLEKFRNCVDQQALDDLGAILVQLKEHIAVRAQLHPSDEPALLPLTADIAATYDRLWDRLQDMYGVTPQWPGDPEVFDVDP